MSKEFPRLFLKFHERDIYNMKPALGRIYQVALREPVEPPSSAPASAEVHTVSVRVDRGMRGSFLFRPAAQRDLDAVKAWVERTRRTEQ